MDQWACQAFGQWVFAAPLVDLHRQRRGCTGRCLAYQVLSQPGARLGIAGQPIAVPATRGERYALLDALERMTVQLTDHSGALLASGKGSDILGHPLNAVVWLAQALQQEEITLQPGDLVSLGSFSPLLPPRAGLSVTATYVGLPGAQPVQVHFQ